MKIKKAPMRRCAGCMESKLKKELIRIAGYEGQVSMDPTGKAKGRGVYLCPSAECFAKAVKKKALSRSLEVEITKEQMEQFAREFEGYAKKNP
ncbi:MAG: YlxR family protein [Clostridiales bacterium]|nr:YlxR family protein [Clostridiales bacterium]